MWATLLVHIGGMSDVSKPQGLIRRGNVWHYRRRIPLDLVGAFGTRRELKESLRTDNLPQAKVRRNLVAAKLEAQFADARAKLNSRPGDAASALPRPQMLEAVQKYVAAED